MNNLSILRLLVFVCYGGLLLPSFSADKNLQEFDQKIKPLLKEFCVKCHGPKKQKAKMRLGSEWLERTYDDNGPPLASHHAAPKLGCLSLLLVGFAWNHRQRTTSFR